MEEVKNSIKINWIAHAEWLTLLVTMLGSFYLLDAKIERCNQRCDRLYEIYCESQKDFHEKYHAIQKDMDQKFYDLLKAQK